MTLTDLLAPASITLKTKRLALPYVFLLMICAGVLAPTMAQEIPATEKSSVQTTAASVADEKTAQRKRVEHLEKNFFRDLAHDQKVIWKAPCGCSLRAGNVGCLCLAGRLP